MGRDVVVVVGIDLDGVKQVDDRFGHAVGEGLRRADAAMYVAKSTGKGRAGLYPDTSLVVGPSLPAW